MSAIRPYSFARPTEQLTRTISAVMSRRNETSRLKQAHPMWNVLIRARRVPRLRSRRPMSPRMDQLLLLCSDGLHTAVARRSPTSSRNASRSQSRPSDVSAQREAPTTSSRCFIQSGGNGDRRGRLRAEAGRRRSISRRSSTACGSPSCLRGGRLTTESAAASLPPPAPGITSTSADARRASDGSPEPPEICSPP